MISPARLAAYRALRDIEAGRLDLAPALVNAREALADARDRALTTEMVTGTLRWRGALDAVIAVATGRPIDRLDLEIRDILRLAAYQILHLTRIPPAAAVSDAVELTRRAGKRSAAPLVNAVLRRIVRERARPPLPLRPEPGASRTAEIDYLASTLSHPRWLVARWRERHGFAAAEAWARFNNTPAPLTLRSNTLAVSTDVLIERLQAHGVAVRRAEYAPDALIVTEGNPLTTGIGEEGLFFVQDEASQLIAHLVGARPGDRILDACASPGGKTTTMAAAMRDRGLLVATDLRGRRIDLLSETVHRSGARSVRLTRMDTTAPLPFGAVFDAALLDAPCSGLGTIRRDPEIRWRRAEDDLVALAETERLMLGRVAAAVRPGGRLVYATCSSEPEENEQVVCRFLESHADFALRDPREQPNLAPGVKAVLDEAGYFRSLPHRHGLEAFFGAVLVRSM